jgi:SET and MYND domain-containing protein
MSDFMKKDTAVETETEIETETTAAAGSSSFCIIASKNPVQIRQLKQKGRHLVATTKTEQGTPLLSNYPTAHLLLTSHWGTKCLYCFKSHGNEVKLSKCSKCHEASYCSRDCQLKDWPQHKLECSKLKYIWGQFNSQLLDEMLILMRQISVEKSMTPDCTVEENPSTSKQVTKCGLSHLHGLYSQPNLSQYQQDFYYKQIIKVVVNYTKKTETEVIKLLNQFHCNNFGIMDDLMNCIGMGVYPSIAILNHSCRPNTILRYLLTAEGPVCEVHFESF